MKKRYFITYIILCSSLFIFSQCSRGSSDSTEQLNTLYAISKYVKYTDIAPVSTTYNKLSLTQDYNYFDLAIPEQAAGENVSFDYTFDPNGSTKDVYFIFTNISTTGNSTYPVINSSQSVSQSILPEGSAAKSKALISNKQIMKGKPEISEFNRHPYAYLNKINPVNMLLSIVPSAEPKNDTVDDITTFKIDSLSSINATCKYVSPAPVSTKFGNKKLNVWVDSNQWGKGANINQTMVNDLASKFLISGDNNDIYDWVTNIYGSEWGTVSASIDPNGDLILPNNEITILLLDIDNDKSPDSGVLGYFWAKDNFNTSAISYSNQRIMFYMDAYIYANHPDEIISALAHELQHMIHFYQKTVLLTNGTGTETWIDEMCSMAAEDLVSQKLGVDGPRGVTYSDPTAGSFGNTNGRLPLYIYYDDASVTNWLSGKYVVVSYSVNYALGAYFSRNYGGAKFFYDVVHNPNTDYTAIEYALHQNVNGLSESFGSILAKWGVANLLSNKTNTDVKYQYNSGTWFDSASYPDSVAYQAGSINMFNYQITDNTGYTQKGPYIYNETHPMPSYAMPPASNEYYYAGSVSDQQTWNIKLRNNVRLTVLAK